MQQVKQQVLQKLLASHKTEALIIDNPIDLYYLTGLHLSLGRLVVLKKSLRLFVDGRYYEACKRLTRIPLTLTQGYGPSSAFAQFFKKELSEKKVAFDSQVTPYASFLELSKLTKNLLPLAEPLATLRMVKTKEEIKKLHQASQLNVKGFRYAASLLKVGVREREVAEKLEIFYLKSGGEGIGFKPIIAFGENSAEPHYRAGESKLKKNDIALIDIGVICNHYHSDMTRVVFVGKKDPELEKIYQVVDKAKAAALKKCKPGIKIRELDIAAREIIEEAGYGAYYPHSLGHGVGLDIHEFPRVRKEEPFGEIVLEPGMAITIEPGIYLPGKGGVRLEDLIVITSKGHDNLVAQQGV